jgi:hypothetical protein
LANEIKKKAREYKIVNYFLLIITWELILFFNLEI